ncbi:GNAT family N-acetyltransferase [Planomicrobium sp. CPCC 101110]|uniref:GNAT family N-acetyltransferase n=1 Tax=Planomicrobium sp. CPCC 101110 TaxID=2599619 RepID=UPI0011B3E9FE|nr:GNAT family N-acetyltransferase [Planomicrobium sp. CPCC 101110]TWT25442.1 GNAT family N-acetyltransferase [Planomicrobium sp. CPCC 101110]
MYRKECFVFQKNEPVLAKVRNYKASDFEALIAVQQESFPPPFPSDLWWKEEQLRSHINHYPDGAFCVEVNGEVVGSMTGLLIDFDPEHPEHTWEEVTANGYISTHNPNGKTLYIVDICVKPAFRQLDLGKLLMQAAYERVVHDRLERVLGGARMPGYHRHSDQLSPSQYVDKVIDGELRDPVITFLMRCGRTPVCLVPNYLDDEESHNHALLMEWKNPFQQM